VTISDLITRDPVPPLPPPRERARLRRVFGVTQQKLADAIGVSRKTVNEWERGTTEPSGSNRTEYAAVLAAWKETERQSKTQGK
jgi:DNA-binding XRE family transcriptional regulator